MSSDTRLLAEYARWARDGWAFNGDDGEARHARKRRTQYRFDSRTATAPKRLNNLTSFRFDAARPIKMLPGAESAPEPVADMVAEKHNFDEWINDNWTGRLHVKRSSTPVRHLAAETSTAPKPFSKASTPAAETEEARTQLSMPSQGDADAPLSSEVETKRHEDEAYTKLHPLIFQGKKVNRDELWDDLVTKGWRTETKRIANGASMQFYIVPGGRGQNDGGQWDEDYFRSFEGVLVYLEQHEDVLADSEPVPAPPVCTGPCSPCAAGRD